MKQFAIILLGFALSSLELPAQTVVAETETYVCPTCGADCDKLTFEKPGACPHCNMPLIKKSRMKNVAMFVYEGMEILDFSGPGEVFAAARPSDGAFRVYTVAVTKDPILSQGFVKIQPEYTLADCPKPDIIVLPGGNSRSSRENPEVINWLKAHASDLDAFVTVCTGAFILEKTGLLEGKKATTWYGAIDRFREGAPKTEVLENVRWVDNGQIITTAGVSAGIDGALHMVEKLFGRETALATAKYMEYDKWKPEDGVVVERP